MTASARCDVYALFTSWYFEASRSSWVRIVGWYFSRRADCCLQSRRAVDDDLDVGLILGGDGLEHQPSVQEIAVAKGRRSTMGKLGLIGSSVLPWMSSCYGPLHPTTTV